MPKEPYNLCNLNTAASAAWLFITTAGMISLFSFTYKQGHDTTAAGITWALYCLGRNPAIQKRVQEEVDLFFGEFRKQI